MYLILKNNNIASFLNKWKQLHYNYNCYSFIGSMLFASLAAAAAALLQSHQSQVKCIVYLCLLHFFKNWYRSTHDPHENWPRLEAVYLLCSIVVYMRMRCRSNALRSDAIRCDAYPKKIYTQYKHRHPSQYPSSSVVLLLSALPHLVT